MLFKTITNIENIENQHDISNNIIIRMPTKYIVSDVHLAVLRQVQVVLIIDRIDEIINHTK